MKKQRDRAHSPLGNKAGPRSTHEDSKQSHPVAISTEKDRMAGSHSRQDRNWSHPAAISTEKDSTLTNG